MAGKTLDLDHVITKDQRACEIANRYQTYVSLRNPWEAQQRELRQYLFSTDTTTTTNSKLPWKNKTTVPKLAQVRDNLIANYMMNIFPRRRWLNWLADNAHDDSKAKRDAILSYMTWVISQPQFKAEILKCIADYVDTGNAFGTVEWVDERIQRDDKIQTGYVGPSPVRVSPFDIAFNPIAPSFYQTGKYVRSFITIGELKKKLEMMSTDENREEYEILFKYLLDYRATVKASGAAELVVKDDFLRVDGFDSWRAYLESDYVEVITYYGDMYDQEANKFYANHVFTVVDRHKLVSQKPNPSYFGYPPIFHVGWRVRQDNLWAMGPLANLVGLQYRIDHVENLKADVFDLIAFPLLKVKGQVQDFEWGPMQRIYCDSDSDVEMVAPPFQVLQADNQIEMYSNTIEMMAGSPKEAMGFRTPGEKTALEVTKLENAAARIFQHKTMQFEEQFLEPLLNAMLEMARRNIAGTQEVNVFDEEFKIQTFLTLSADDITGAGKVKPIGARHFAEKAEMAQNLTNFYQSGPGRDPMVLNHFSSIKTAQMFEELLDLKDYELVLENVRLAEAQKAQQLQAAGQQQSEMAMSTASGIGDDFDIPPEEQTMPAPPQPEEA